MAYDYSLTAAYPGETEEERRKRLANQMVGKTEVQTFADGSQTRTTTQEIPAAGPVAPEQVPAPAAAPVAEAQPMPTAQLAQAAAPVDPNDERRRRALEQRPPLPAAAAPAAGLRTPEQEAADDEAIFRATGVRPQATPVSAPVQPAAVPAAPAAAPAAGQGLRIPGLATTPFAPPSTASIDLYQQSQDNPEALLRLRGDQNQPEWIRERAGARAYELLDSEIKKKQAESQAQQLTQQAAQGDRRASMTIAKELQNQQGSYLKMILLGFLSPELAGEEAVKLGFGNKWQTVTDQTGQPALVQINARGLPLKGYKADGSMMADNELIAYAGGGTKDYDIVGGTYVNDVTGEVGSVYRNKRNPADQFVMTEKGRRPLTGFRPQGQAGTLDMQRVQQIQRQNIELAGDWAKLQMRVQGAAPEAANRFLGEFNAKHGTNFGLQNISGAAPQIDITTGQMAVGGAPVAAAPAAPVARPPAAPPAAPVAAAPAAPVTRPPVTTPAPAPAARPGGTPAEIEARVAAGAAGMKKEAEVGAEDIATIRKNQGSAESNADYLVTRVNDLITHPGFEVSVGASAQPGFQFIPGTDKASWYAAFDEVKGQQFLQAVKELKGMGALSDREGEAATKAISRMSTMQNEQEFRKAAQDFNDIVTRGVDRNRVKLGQPPKYATPEASARAAQDAAAKKWLDANPKHPDAAAVRQRLRDRGLL